MRVTWRWAALVGAVVLLCGAATAAASPPATSEPPAGARLDSAPAEVRVVMDVALEDAFLRLEVRTSDGRLVSGPAARDPRDDRAMRAAVDAGARGPLTVAWRALTRDGHAAGGAFGLGVGAAAPAPRGDDVVREGSAPVPVLARLLGLIGPLGLLGLVVLAAGVAVPAARAGGLEVTGDAPGERAGLAADAQRALAGAAPGWWRAWWAAALAGAAGLVLTPVAHLWTLREGPGELGALLSQTRAGAAWWVQVAGLLGAVVLATRIRRAGLPAGPTAWALAAGPLAALAAISASGHAATGSDATPNVVIDLIHSAATAAWIGGLVGLVALAVPALGALAEPARTRLAAGVVVRFSALALTCVAALVVTGVYRALAEVSAGELLDSGYGRVLVAKIALFAAMLGAGAYNRMVVHPRLERAAMGLAADDRGAGAALGRSVRVELLLAAAVLVAVAVLAGIAPPG